jgi:hypothetical protein
MVNLKEAAHMLVGYFLVANAAVLLSMSFAPVDILEMSGMKGNTNIHSVLNWFETFMRGCITASLVG